MFHKSIIVSITVVSLMLGGGLQAADKMVLVSSAFDNNKLSETLHADLANNNKETYEVVVTVSDEIDEASVLAGKATNVNAVMKKDKHQEIVYQLNEQSSDLGAIQSYGQEIRNELERLNEARKEVVKNNLAKIKEALKTPNKSFEQALEQNSKSFVIEMSQEELADFAKKTESSIKYIDYEPSLLAGTTDALSDMNIIIPPVNFYRSTNMGDGVSIIVGDYGVGIGNLVGSNFTRYNYNDNLYEQHATKTARLVRLAAPNSPIHAVNGPSTDFDSPGKNPEDSSDLDSISVNDLLDDLASTSDPILVESYSLQWYSGGSFSRSYLNYDQAYDNHIYQERINSTICSGNYYDPENLYRYVSSPGKAMNAITVGWYADDNDTIANNSCGVDSTIGHQKPEVVAPGVILDIEKADFTTYSNQSGCSFATPLAAGFVASAISDISYLEGSPATVKALVLASATDEINGDSEKVGLGGIDYDSLKNHWRSLAYWYDGNGDGPFASSGFSCYSGWTTHLDASETRARVAIAWFNRGDYVKNHAEVGMNLDLYVIDPNNNNVGASSITNNPYELVEFNPSISGDYTVKICRSAKNDINSRLDMGMAVVAY